MKFVSIILIIAYLMLPAICFGHPCEPLPANAPQSATVADDPGGCPFSQDTDSCETTCCCAGHVPLSAFTENRNFDPAAKLLTYAPNLALPRIIDRIFVPPQNLS